MLRVSVNTPHIILDAMCRDSNVLGFTLYKMKGYSIDRFIHPVASWALVTDAMKEARVKGPVTIFASLQSRSGQMLSMQIVCSYCPIYAEHFNSGVGAFNLSASPRDTPFLVTMTVPRIAISSEIIQDLRKQNSDGISRPFFYNGYARALASPGALCSFGEGCISMGHTAGAPLAAPPTIIAWTDPSHTNPTPWKQPWHPRHLQNDPGDCKATELSCSQVKPVAGHMPEMHCDIQQPTSRIPGESEMSFVRRIRRKYSDHPKPPPRPRGPAAAASTQAGRFDVLRHVDPTSPSSPLPAVALEPLFAPGGRGARAGLRETDAGEILGAWSISSVVAPTPTPESAGQEPAPTGASHPPAPADASPTAVARADPEGDPDGLRRPASCDSPASAGAFLDEDGSAAPAWADWRPEPALDRWWSPGPCPGRVGSAADYVAAVDLSVWGELEFQGGLAGDLLGIE
jgi:hypothetical protein